MVFLKALWQGEVALIKTYWLYGALGSFLLLGIPVIVFELSGVYGTTDLATLITLFIYSLVFVPAYIIFVSVAIWRSANRYTGSVWWAGLAKLAVVVGIGRWIMEFAKEFQ